MGDMEAQNSSGKRSERDSSNDDENKVLLEDIEACAAFVVFNYCESMARCVEDYEHYDTWFYRVFSCWYPRQLLFRGQRIKVRKAPGERTY